MSRYNKKKPIFVTTSSIYDILFIVFSDILNVYQESILQMQHIFYVIEHVNRTAPSWFTAILFAWINGTVVASVGGPWEVLFDVLEPDHGFTAIFEKFSEISKYLEIITK